MTGAVNFIELLRGGGGGASTFLISSLFFTSGGGSLEMVVTSVITTLSCFGVTNVITAFRDMRSTTIRATMIMAVVCLRGDVRRI